MKLTSRLLDPKFKKEVVKMVKEIRKVIDRNADYCKKELDCSWINEGEMFLD